jgi:hypothetical protein
VKHTDYTHRYLGTLRTDASGTLEDTKTQRFVSNYYNRVSRELLVADTAASWTWNNSGAGNNSWRSADNKTSNRVEIVSGNGDAFLELIVNVSGATGGTFLTFYDGIGEDITNNNSASNAGSCADSSICMLHAYLRKLPTAGYHYYQWVEDGGGNTTVTWYSSTGSGLTGFIDQ